ncbi:MAG: T9SS type A sorting domain-containing protein, partial [Bacteroidota bacterium]
KWFTLRQGSLLFRDTTATSIRFKNQFAPTGLKLYPNPARETVQLVGMTNQLPATARLYDPLGRLVWTTCSVHDELRLPELPAGTYVLHTQQGKKRWINRLVIY